MAVSPTKSYVSGISSDADEQRALAAANRDVDAQAVEDSCGGVEDGVYGEVIGGIRGSSCGRYGEVFKCVSTLTVHSEDIRCILLPKDPK